MTAGEFREALNELINATKSALQVRWGKLVLETGWVGEIGIKNCRCGDSRPYVKLKENMNWCLHADHVVIMTGPGEDKKLTAVLDRCDQQTKKAIEVDWRADGSITTGGKFMEGRSQVETYRGKSDWSVFIYGGSATSSWAAETALLRDYRVAGWWTRCKKDDNSLKARFAAAFPPGNRNYIVQTELERVRGVYDIERIIDHGASGLRGGPFTIVGNREGTEKRVTADQIVMCLGSNSEETFSKFFPNGYNAGILKLEPKYDRNWTISGSRDTEHKLLGFGTADNEILILGSAVATAGNLTAEAKIDNAKSFGSIANTLPRALAPDQGIGVLTAAIEAFNQFMPVEVTGTEKMYTLPEYQQAPGKGHGLRNRPVDGQHAHVTNQDIKWNINFNTANRDQLAAYFASETDYEAIVANFFVALIVECRAYTIHGLSQQSINNIIDHCQWNKGLLKRLAVIHERKGGVRWGGAIDFAARWVAATDKKVIRLLGTPQERDEYRQGLKQRDLRVILKLQG
jgi:hypothetical protein